MASTLKKKATAKAAAKSPAKTVTKKEFPAPAPLATVTNLDQRDAHRVTTALAGLVADAFSLYVKYKNFHWHVTGSQFAELHELFDGHAAQLLPMIDALAERARKVGGTSIRSIGHIRELTRIADDNDDFVAPEDMIVRLIEDNLTFDRMLREAYGVSDRAGDAATTSVIENFLDETQERIWFLDASRTR